MGWQKGQSGNPKGRPKQTRWRDSINAVLDIKDDEGQTYREKITQRWVRIAAGEETIRAVVGKGEDAHVEDVDFPAPVQARAFELVMDREEGKPAQTQHNTYENLSPDQMTDAQLAEASISELAELRRRLSDHNGTGSSQGDKNKLN